MCSLVRCLIIITDPVAEIIGGVLGGALGVLVLVAVVVVVRYMKLVCIEHSAIHSWAAGSEERDVCRRYDSLGISWFSHHCQPRMVVNR